MSTMSELDRQMKDAVDQPPTHEQATNEAKFSQWPVNGKGQCKQYRVFKSIKDVYSSHFTFAKEGNLLTFRLLYDDGLVRASIVTILPNQMGLYGHLGLAGHPTTYEVQWHAPIYVSNPSSYLPWEEIIRIVEQIHEGLTPIKNLQELSSEVEA